MSLQHGLVPASPARALFNHLPNISKFSVLKLLNLQEIVGNVQQRVGLEYYGFESKYMRHMD
jgi:hypothetical protein